MLKQSDIQDAAKRKLSKAATADSDEHLCVRVEVHVEPGHGDMGEEHDDAEEGEEEEDAQKPKAD